MSLADVRAHLARFGQDDSIVVFDTSSATVDLAAAALGVQPARIAKTLSLYSEDGTGAMLIVAAGDARLSNGAFKRRFGYKPRMLRAADVAPLTGHEIGGVCPFGNPEGVPVWLDESLRRFDRVWPAAGDTSSAVGLTPDELELISGARGWVDVTNGWHADAE
ncbi:MAG TPA: YbaK/EbsC family protein [Pseudonocardiaceae bacterium]